MFIAAIDAKVNPWFSKPTPRLGGTQGRRTKMANHPNRSLAARARKIIKNKMIERGAARYRITANNEVHFYGQMPNSIETGWWLAHQDADRYAAEIIAESAND